MIESLGICKGIGDILGQIRVGSDCVFISKIGKYFYTLLNKRTIIVAKSKKELINRTTPVLSTILQALTKKHQTDTIKWKPVQKNYTKMFEDVLKNISENTKPYGIYVLKLKPDELSDNAIIDSSNKPSMTDRLRDYNSSLNKIDETVTNLMHVSRIILKTNLDKKVWGSKEVMGTINNVRTGFIILSKEMEKIEGCMEQSDQFTGKLHEIINRKLQSNPKEIVGKITENYSILKSFLSEAAQTLYPLTIIDNVFMTNTGYPATWFINSSVLNDFDFEYDNLINHIIKSASVEADVIEPLFIWKVKLMGESNV